MHFQRHKLTTPRVLSIIYLNYAVIGLDQRRLLSMSTKYITLMCHLILVELNFFGFILNLSFIGMYVLCFQVAKVVGIISKLKDSMFHTINSGLPPPICMV